MRARYQILEHQYRRRMALSYPLATLTWAIFLVSLPGEDLPLPRNPTVGLRGRMAVVPEVDIIPEEISERRLTAAPKASAPSDFEIYELEAPPTDWGDPVPPRRITRDSDPGIPRELPIVPDLQTAVRTTGHPVLAQTDVEVLHMERPVYPAEAIQAGMHGLVEVVILVDTQGRVAQAHVVRPDRVPILEMAALRAAKRSFFRVYLRDGKPTAFWVRIPYEFRLVAPG